MTESGPLDIERYCRETGRRAREASRALAELSTERKNAWLRDSARSLRAHLSRILAANADDVRRARDAGEPPAMIDRLKLDEPRVEGMAKGLEAIAALPDPVGEVIEGSRRPNGLEVTRLRVPLGVVFFVYESRPNVTVDAAAICVKSGNAVILRGGKEAMHSSRVLVDLMAVEAERHEIPPFAVQLVGPAERELVGGFLRQPEFIDVAIPRGGTGLIERVVAEARMPVIRHHDGNCHVYVDSSADFDRALAIIDNAKCQRPGVCNALESLLVHDAIADRFLPRLAERLAMHGVELRGCQRTREILPTALEATEADWRAEYLALILSIRIVDSIDEAIEHIAHYGSKHTDAIVANDVDAIRRFTARVDSAAVMVNASTRFNDGGELGMGAEIGISTDKFHARGPCGLRELTSYKFVCVGDGLIRS
ncbi:MAG TPA: glutamate-5-semialdehyde dehydrogenase [Planctomycetaceae bacterium]|nr:glutamate-5-semialdehyde dehydrogenase [Planctomycetaceae bacterium]HRF02898.1 glutamate-5-semialdehyde dehydrogenase [Pirellulaceae bacterium]